MDTSCKKDENLRKTNKQEMERRRRARMNNSIEKLKSIMQKNGFISDADCMKIEKAEILDKVVEFCNQTCSMNTNDKTNQLKNLPNDKISAFKQFSKTHTNSSQRFTENSPQLDIGNWNIINPNAQSNHISRFSVISTNHSIINQSKNRTPFAPLNSNQISLDNSICNTKSECRVFKRSFLSQLDSYSHKTNKNIKSEKIWKPYE